VNATLVVLPRRPEAQVVAPKFEDGSNRHQLRRPRSNCELRHQLFRGNPQREPLNGEPSHILPEKSGSPADRIKLSACNHDDRIINWSSSVRSAQPESPLPGP
jgi:hypothetical protein